MLDQGIFHKACGLGMRPAVALLVLTRFTGRNGTTTRASAHAIEQRTGIGRKAAADAIEALVRAGIVTRSGSMTRPKYTIAQVVDTRLPLSPNQAAALARALRGEKLSRSDNALMGNVVLAGHALRRDQRWEEVPPPDREPVWLPNALVDGIDGRESPVELVRQTGDAMALRLLVDLYATHRLDEWGGINPKVVREEFREVFRHAVGTVFVLAFEPQRKAADWNSITEPHRAPPPETGRNLWERLNILQRFGLVHFVPHVLDGDGATAYPCSAAVGESDERELGVAARHAAEALILDVGDPASRAAFGDHFHKPGTVVVVVPRHMERASVVGIGRLKFRARTRANTAWLTNLTEISAKWLPIFAQMKSQHITRGHVGAKTG